MVLQTRFAGSFFVASRESDRFGEQNKRCKQRPQRESSSPFCSSVRSSDGKLKRHKINRDVYKRLFYDVHFLFLRDILRRVRISLEYIYIYLTVYNITRIRFKYNEFLARVYEFFLCEKRLVKK